MSWYKEYKLIQDGNNYVVEIYLNPNDSEFSKEFFENIKENILTLDDHVKRLIEEKYPDLKINTVKLMMGALVVGTIPFINTANVKAAEITGTTVQSTASTYNITQISTTGTVTADTLNVRSSPSTSGSIIHKLYYGNTIPITGQTTGWYQIKLSDGRVGYVSSTYIKLAAPTREQKINTVISTAKSLLGTPYVWGGESLAEGGFDCSGFTQYVYKQVGVSLNRISADQATQGVTVARTALQPGDLVFYSLAGDGRISHVGIYIGDGKMIHSPKTGDVVKTTDITTSYWESKFITAKRVI